jgi:hypothetical protein
MFSLQLISSYIINLFYGTTSIAIFKPIITYSTKIVLMKTSKFIFLYAIKSIITSIFLYKINSLVKSNKIIMDYNYVFVNINNTSTIILYISYKLMCLIVWFIISLTSTITNYNYMSRENKYN